LLHLVGLTRHFTNLLVIAEVERWTVQPVARRCIDYIPALVREGTALWTTVKNCQEFP